MFVKERTAGIIFVGVPLIYVLLFGNLYDEDTINHIPAVVYDQDQTSLSRSVVQAFDDSRRFRIISYVNTQEEFEEWLREKRAIVGISIPSDFSRHVKKGLGSEVLFEANAGNILFSNSAIASAQEIISNVSAAIGKSLLEAGGELPNDSVKKASPLAVRVRVMNNPTFAYTNFILPGLGANGLQIGIILVAGPLMNQEYRRLNTWYGVKTPVIVLGKLLTYWLCGCTVFIVYTLMAVYWFLLPCRGAWGTMLLIGSAYVFAIAAIGCLIGAIAPDEVQAALLPLLYIMPALLFSGYIWPQLSMNTFSRIFSAVAPISYIADNMRDLMLSGYAPHVFHDAFVLYAAGTIVLILAIMAFGVRRSKAHNGEAAL